MTASQASCPTERPVRGWARPRTNLAAFLVGLPLAAGALYWIHHGPLQDTIVAHYVKNPVEWVEVLLFGCALGALGAKLWNYQSERRACHTEVLPSWDGEPVPVSQAAHLLAGLSKLPWRLQGTYLVRRVESVLDFLCSRGSAAELDDHLRTQAD